MTESDSPPQYDSYKAAYETAPDPTAKFGVMFQMLRQIARDQRLDITDPEETEEPLSMEDLTGKRGSDLSLFFRRVKVPGDEDQTDFGINVVSALLGGEAQIEQVGSEGMAYRRLDMPEQGRTKYNVMIPVEVPRKRDRIRLSDLRDKPVDTLKRIARLDHTPEPTQTRNQGHQLDLPDPLGRGYGPVKLLHRIGTEEPGLFVFRHQYHDINETYTNADFIDGEITISLPGSEQGIKLFYNSPDQEKIDDPMRYNSPYEASVVENG